MSRRMRLPRPAATGNPPLDNILNEGRHNVEAGMPIGDFIAWIPMALALKGAPRKRKKTFNRWTRAYLAEIRRDPEMLRCWEGNFYEAIQEEADKRAARP